MRTQRRRSKERREGLRFGLPIAGRESSEVSRIGGLCRLCLLAAGLLASGCSLLTPDRAPPGLREQFLSQTINVYWQARPGAPCPDEQVCLDFVKGLEEFERLVGEKALIGLQLTVLDVSWTWDQPVFVGVWEPRPRKHLVRLDMSMETFRKEYRKPGYRLIHFKSYRSIWEEKIAAIWEPIGPILGPADAALRAEESAVFLPDEIRLNDAFPSFLEDCRELRSDGYYLAEIELSAPVHHLTVNDTAPYLRDLAADPPSPIPTPDGCGWQPSEKWLTNPLLSILPTAVEGEPPPSIVRISGLWRPGFVETRLLTGLSCEHDAEVIFPDDPVGFQRASRCPLLLELEQWSREGFHLADLEAYGKNSSWRFAALLHRSPSPATASPVPNWLMLLGWLGLAMDQDPLLRQGEQPGVLPAGIALFPIDLDLPYSNPPYIGGVPLHNGLVHNAGTSGPPDG